MTDLRDPAHRVSPRALAMWHVEMGLEAAATAAAAIIAAAVWAPDAVRGWLTGAAVVVAVAASIVVPQWRYRLHRWEVSATAVYTQRGWWARERRVAPMSRVQTVDFAQGPLARLFGLATLTLTTASAAGALQIEGLDQQVAVRLADELTRRAEDAGGDAT